MSLLDILLFLLVCLHLLQSYWQLVQMSTSLAWISQRQLSTPPGASTNILHLLIPVYKESGIIKSCVQYFENFASCPNVYIHYVTTEKEGINSDTVLILKELSKSHSFSLLHYPNKEGIKSHQLNWAIAQILANDNGVDDRNIYFGIYDVDSRPEFEMIKTILYGEDPIYQQPSIYLENFKRIDTFQKAGALLQTKWELCRNVPVLRDYQSKLLLKQKISSLPCCTGHGLFIRADVFHKVGFFDTETLAEDIEFGYRSAFYGIPITSLKEIDFTEYAPSFLATIPQTSRWFSGEMKLYRYYLQASKSWSLTFLVLKRYYTTLKWALGAPIIFTASIILALRYPLSIVFVFLSFYMYIYKPFKMLYNSPLWKDYVRGKTSLFVLLLLGCIRPLFNAFGPYHYFLTTLINAIQGKPDTFVRTPKN